MEYLWDMRTAEAGRVEMTIQELQYPEMRSYQIVGSLLSSRQRLFIGWSKFFLLEEGITMTENISKALLYQKNELASIFH